MIDFSPCERFESFVFGNIFCCFICSEAFHSEDDWLKTT